MKQSKPSDQDDAVSSEPAIRVSLINAAWMDIHGEMRTIISQAIVVAGERIILFVFYVRVFMLYIVV
jgi:hypothetical protein